MLFSKFKWFYPYELSSDVTHIQRSGHFAVYVILKSSLVRGGTDSVRDQLDFKIVLGVT